MCFIKGKRKTHNDRILYFILAFLIANATLEARLAPDNERFQMGLIKCRKTISANLHADIFDMTGSSGLAVREFLNGLQNSRERTAGRKRKRIF